MRTYITSQTVIYTFTQIKTNKSPRKPEMSDFNFTTTIDRSISLSDVAHQDKAFRTPYTQLTRMSLQLHMRKRRNQVDRETMNWHVPTESPIVFGATNSTTISIIAVIRYPE